MLPSPNCIGRPRKTDLRTFSLLSGIEALTLFADKDCNSTGYEESNEFAIAKLNNSRSTLPSKDIARLKRANVLGSKAK